MLENEEIQNIHSNIFDLIFGKKIEIIIKFLKLELEQDVFSEMKLFVPIEREGDKRNYFLFFSDHSSILIETKLSLYDNKLYFIHFMIKPYFYANVNCVATLFPHISVSCINWDEPELHLWNDYGLYQKKDAEKLDFMLQNQEPLERIRMFQDKNNRLKNGKCYICNFTRIHNEYMMVSENLYRWIMLLYAQMNQANRWIKLKKINYISSFYDKE